MHGTAIFRYRITSGTSNPRQILMKHKNFRTCVISNCPSLLSPPKWIVAHRHLQSVNKAVCESERFLFRDMYFVPFCLLLLQRPLDIEKTEESLASLAQMQNKFYVLIICNGPSVSIFVCVGSERFAISSRLLL